MWPAKACKRPFASRGARRTGAALASACAQGVQGHGATADVPKRRSVPRRKSRSNAAQTQCLQLRNAEGRSSCAQKPPPSPVASLMTRIRHNSLSRHHAARAAFCTYSSGRLYVASLCVYIHRKTAENLCKLRKAQLTVPLSRALADCSSVAD